MEVEETDENEQSFKGLYLKFKGLKTVYFKVSYFFYFIKISYIDFIFRIFLKSFNQNYYSKMSCSLFNSNLDCLNGDYHALNKKTFSKQMEVVLWQQQI